MPETRVVIAIVKRWRKYRGLEHIACGFLCPADFAVFGTATLTFGDGSFIEITDPEDIHVTELPWSTVDE